MAEKEEPEIVIIDLTGDDDDEKELHGTTVQCRICLDFPKVPVATMCGHVFCLDCLSKALRLRSSCPACRQTHNFHRLHF